MGIQIIQSFVAEIVAIHGQGTATVPDKEHTFYLMENNLQ